MRYLKIFESIEEEFLDTGVKAIALIKEQNDLVQDAEDIFVEVLDVIGHDIVPEYTLAADGNGEITLDTPEMWEYFGLSIHDIDSPAATYKEALDFLSECGGREVELKIKYQHPSEKHGWNALEMTAELREAIDSVQERLSSIGCEIEEESSNLGIKEMGIWSVSVIVPVTTDFSGVVSASVPKNIVGDFEAFLKRYSIDEKGKKELANIIRRADYGA
jgi:hypothetical protein